MESRPLGKNCEADRELCSIAAHLLMALDLGQERVDAGERLVQRYRVDLAADLAGLDPRAMTKAAYSAGLASVVGSFGLLGSFDGAGVIPSASRIALLRRFKASSRADPSVTILEICMVRLVGLPDDNWSPGDKPGREAPEPDSLGGRTEKQP